MCTENVVHEIRLDWPASSEYAIEQEPLWVVIIDAPEATVLFGSGDETTADQLTAVARDHGVDIVVVEHGDPDHYEGVPSLREALDVEIAVPADDEQRLEEAGISPDHLLYGGESHWGFETIAAPGHTPGNMAFVFEDTLIAGDTVIGRDSVFAVDYDWSGTLAVIVPEWNVDDEMMRQSVRTLRDAQFESVLVAHGTSVYENGTQAIETLLDDLATM